MRPSCANEWIQGICKKPRIKCADCPNRRFLPVTDDVIRWHLTGRDADGTPFVAGVYPLLSYDRLFQNQDTMPQGGFGNLIALPLQKGPRTQENSVFLDDQLAPWEDQWVFLASVHKIGRAQVKRIVQDTERHGRILGYACHFRTMVKMSRGQPHRRSVKEPPIVGELPRTLELVLVNQIFIEKSGLHPGLRNGPLRLAAFQNHEFYKAQAMRLSAYDNRVSLLAPRVTRIPIGLERGCLDDLCQLLTDLGVRALIRDAQTGGLPVSVTFKGELRPEHLSQPRAMLAHDRR